MTKQNPRPAPPSKSEDSAETERLLADVRAGDRLAFDRLLARHRASLRAFVALRLDSRLRARFDPSDIVQETQAEAYNRLDDYLDRRPMSFRAWLLRTAYQRLQKEGRRHRQARRDVVRELRLPDKSSAAFAQSILARSNSPSRAMSQQELSEQLTEALKRLSPTDREVVVMRNFEGLSNPEIAYLLDLTSDAVSKRYGRALLRLHKLLGDEATP